MAPAGLLEVLRLGAAAGLGRPSVVALRAVELFDRGCRVPMGAWFG